MFFVKKKREAVYTQNQNKNFIYIIHKCQIKCVIWIVFFYRFTSGNDCGDVSRIRFAKPDGRGCKLFKLIWYEHLEDYSVKQSSTPIIYKIYMQLLYNMYIKTVRLIKSFTYYIRKAQYANVLNRSKKYIYEHFYICFFFFSQICNFICNNIINLIVLY